LWFPPLQIINNSNIFNKIILINYYNINILSTWYIFVNFDKKITIGAKMHFNLWYIICEIKSIYSCLDFVFICIYAYIFNFKLYKIMFCEIFNGFFHVNTIFLTNFYGVLSYFFSSYCNFAQTITMMAKFDHHCSILPNITIGFSTVTVILLN